MWGFREYGWGTALLLWMLLVWTAVVLTVWLIFRNIGGPKHRLHH